MCEKNLLVWKEDTGSLLFHDFLRSSVSKDHLYGCLSPSLSFTQSWASKLYPTMANQKNVTRNKNNTDGKVQFEASISIYVLLCHFCHGKLELWVFSWEISLSSVTKMRSQHFTGVWCKESNVIGMLQKAKSFIRARSPFNSNTVS